jgi:hypothetical protein
MKEVPNPQKGSSKAKSESNALGLIGDSSFSTDWPLKKSWPSFEGDVNPQWESSSIQIRLTPQAVPVTLHIDLARQLLYQLTNAIATYDEIDDACNALPNE